MNEFERILAGQRSLQKSRSDRKILSTPSLSPSPYRKKNLSYISSEELKDHKRQLTRPDSDAIKSLKSRSRKREISKDFKKSMSIDYNDLK